jgi:Mor family transcriptional regulator
VWLPPQYNEPNRNSNQLKKTIEMNWDSKDKKYYEIESKLIRNRVKEVNRLHESGTSVKDLAIKYQLSESRIREYLKKQ